MVQPKRKVSLISSDNKVHIIDNILIGNRFANAEPKANSNDNNNNNIFDTLNKLQEQSNGIYIFIIIVFIVI